MKPETPRLWFVDFWHHESESSIIAENQIFSLLNEFFTVRLDSQNPEWLIYSIFGFRHRAFSCPRVCIIGENRKPDFTECDFAFSFDETGGRNFRLPLWAWQLGNPARALSPSLAPEMKRKFCAFVASNCKPKVRNQFFQILHSKKHIDAAGRCFHNTEGLAARDSKKAFVDLPLFYRDYKFAIAFENAASPGYTTEKIIAPLIGGAVPIYWGNPEIATDFDPRCFIHARQFDTLEALADHVLRVDADDELYARYARAPKFPGDEIPPDANWRIIADRFTRIFDSRYTRAAKPGFFDRAVLPRLPYRILKRLARRRENKQSRPHVA